MWDPVNILCNYITELIPEKKLKWFPSSCLALSLHQRIDIPLEKPSVLAYLNKSKGKQVICVTGDVEHLSPVIYHGRECTVVVGCVVIGVGFSCREKVKQPTIKGDIKGWCVCFWPLLSPEVKCQGQQ